MCHLRKSVHNNKHGILSILSSRQTKYEIHANVFPRLLRNRKRHVKTMGLSFRLSFATCRALVGEAVDVAKHLGPIVVLGERSGSLSRVQNVPLVLHDIPIKITNKEKTRGCKVC